MGESARTDGLCIISTNARWSVSERSVCLWRWVSRLISLWFSTGFEKKPNIHLGPGPGANRRVEFPVPSLWAKFRLGHFSAEQRPGIADVKNGVTGRVRSGLSVTELERTPTEGSYQQSHFSESFQDMVFKTWDLNFGAWIFTLAVSKIETWKRFRMWDLNFGTWISHRGLHSGLRPWAPTFCTGTLRGRFCNPSLCPSVRSFVCPSVCPSVCPFVRLSVCPNVFFLDLFFRNFLPVS